MAYLTTNRSASAPLGLTARLAEIRKDLAASWRAYRVYRRTLAELRELSPRELADLGMSGSMLRAIAQEAAYGTQAQR